MIVELGHFALVLALVCAALQALLPIFGSLYRVPNWQAVAKPAAQAQFLCLAVAMAALVVLAALVALENEKNQNRKN